MTERKTLNKYFPIDFDPAKIPKLKGKQKEANRLWGIRVMAPFNMRCNTCGEYVYKGKKFNSKKETVEDESYLGIQIHRFYIRCPKCVAVIAFKTDPEHCDYTLEAGATRNFEAAKTLLEMEKKKQKELEDEEAANPMKVLENRTKQSRNEMDMMEALTELRELNARHEKVDHEGMITKMALYQKELERLQKEEEDRLVRELYGSVDGDSNGETIIRRLEDDDEDDDEDEIPSKRAKAAPANPTDLLTNTTKSSDTKTNESSASKPLPSYLQSKPKSTKFILSNLVRVKKPASITAQKTSETSVSATPTDSNSSNHSIKKGNSSSASTSHSSGDTRPSGTGALGMLGGYSSSENESD